MLATMLILFVSYILIDLLCEREDFKLRTSLIKNSVVVLIVGIIWATMS